MPLPVLLVIVGQQVFRIAATAAAKRAAAAVGGKIVKEVPKALAKKTVRGEAAFTQLVKAKKPTLTDKIGNLFTKKPKKITQSTAGKIDKKDGIKINKNRITVRSRGDKVVGAASVAIPGAAVVAAALKKYRADLAKERSKTKAAQNATDIEKTLGKIVVAEEKLKTLKAQTKNAGPPKSRTSPSAPSKSLRPKMPSKPRPKK